MLYLLVDCYHRIIKVNNTIYESCNIPELKKRETTPHCLGKADNKRKFFGKTEAILNCMSVTPWVHYITHNMTYRKAHELVGSWNNGWNLWVGTSGWNH